MRLTAVLGEAWAASYGTLPRTKIYQDVSTRICICPCLVGWPPLCCDPPCLFAQPDGRRRGGLCVPVVCFNRVLVIVVACPVHRFHACGMPSHRMPFHIVYMLYHQRGVVPFYSCIYLSLYLLRHQRPASGKACTPTTNWTPASSRPSPPRWRTLTSSSCW